jgi:8-oxo-dGTP pyrophosphatase MutT (NUDIX family)
MTKKSVFSGNLFRILHLKQPDGRTFEVAERAPGVRLIIVSHDRTMILLTREVRRELDGAIDWRLPGGKVFDSLEEFIAHEDSGDDILTAASQKAIEEARQETGLVIKNPKYFYTSRLGATVSWDLYFFEVTDWQKHPDGQQLINGRDVEDISVEWVELSLARQLALTEMQEERAALVLLRWLDGLSK